MNRRSFLKSTAGAGAALASLPLLSTLEGCSSSTVINEINVILEQVVAIFAVAEPNAAWVPQLSAAVGALKTAESGWQGGGPVQELIDALNTVESVTAAIPLTATYSPLIDVLVAGIEAVLAALPQPAQSAVANRAVIPNLHIGRAVIERHFLHSLASDFKLTWNAVVSSRPDLAAARLK